MSEVGCNSSPGLFGSLLFITSFSVNNVYSLISALQWYSDAQNLQDSVLDTGGALVELASAQVSTLPAVASARGS